jgi:hypothetical protein
MATLPTFKGKNSDDFQNSATKAAAITAAGL